MQYILERTTFGWCWWDLVAAIVLIGVIVYAAVTLKKMKQQHRQLEERLGSKEAADAVAREDS